LGVTKLAGWGSHRLPDYTKIEKGTLEIGGDLSGGYVNQSSGSGSDHFFGLILQPSGSYYFSSLFFASTGATLQYSYASFSGTIISGGGNLGIGIYFRLNEKMVLATSFQAGLSGVLYNSNPNLLYTGGNWSMALRPQLKYQINENVILSFILGIYANYSNWSEYSRSGVSYGIGWSYIW
jgi:hypothetical protein